MWFKIYSISTIILVGLAYLGIKTHHKSFLGSLFAAFLSAFVVLLIEMELKPGDPDNGRGDPPMLSG